MKAFVTIQDAYVPNNSADILVPWYPAPVQNMFVSTVTFEKHTHGVVVDADFDIDTACANLTKQYPGIPREMHERYVIKSCVAAAKFEVGTRVRPVITIDSAMVQDVDGTQHVTLWGRPSGV